MRHAYTVHPLEPPDFARAAEIMCSAYQGEGFLEKLVLQHALEPQGCLGVWNGPALLGTAAYIAYGTYAVVGMVATDPDAQGRGVARAGMDALLEALERLHIKTTVLDASKQGKPLYEKLGFLERGQFHLYKAGWTYAEPRETPTRTASLNDLEWMGALDAEATGGDRSALLERLFDGQNVRVLALENQGFVVVNGAQIGPMVALDRASAEILLEAILSLEFRRAPVLLVPVGNFEVCGLLESLGFERQRSWTHMERGAARAGNRALYWALASFALG